MTKLSRGRTPEPIDAFGSPESEQTQPAVYEFPSDRQRRDFGVLLFVAIGSITLFAGCTSRTTGRVPIHAIQGSAHASPMDGQRLEMVEGVVTAVLEDQRAPRFWIQSLRPDSSEATSEGIVVMTRGAAQTHPAVGDVVNVTATVHEWGREGELTQTELVDPVWTVLGRAKLPDPVRIPSMRQPPGIVDHDGMRIFDAAFDAIDFWESLEGMLVEIESPVVIGPTSRFGDAIVLSGPDWRVAQPKTRRGGVRVTPDDEHPQKIVLDGRLVGGVPDFRVGERIEGNLRGVVGHEFGIQRIFVLEKPRSEGKPDWPADRTALVGSSGSVTVASWNVLNLAATDSAAKFERIGRIIADAMRGPDIVGLQEVQDDTGGKDDKVTTAEMTLRRLVAAIASAGGPHYEFRQIDPIDSADGGAPGSNIRTAFLYNPARVSFTDRGNPGSMTEAMIATDSSSVLLKNPSRLGTTTPCFLGEGSSDEAEGTRKSLVGEFVVEGRNLVVINNHLKSKRGDDSVFGSVQPPVRKTEEQRRCQARLIGDFVEELSRNRPDVMVVVLGDLNEYEFRSPLDAFADAGLVDLIERTPIEERYTYNYQGNSQVLDHILVRADRIDDAELDVVHVTVDEPESAQASDHEPLILRLDL